MSKLQWSGDQMARRATGTNGEFVVSVSIGKFDLVQRRRVGAASRKKFVTLRQATGLTRDAAIRAAQQWEDEEAPTECQSTPCLPRPKGGA